MSVYFSARAQLHAFKCIHTHHTKPARIVPAWMQRAKDVLHPGAIALQQCCQPCTVGACQKLLRRAGITAIQRLGAYVEVARQQNTASGSEPGAQAQLKRPVQCQLEHEPFLQPFLAGYRRTVEVDEQKGPMICHEDAALRIQCQGVVRGAAQGSGDVAAWVGLGGCTIRRGQRARQADCRSYWAYRGSSTHKSCHASVRRARSPPWAVCEETIPPRHDSKRQLHLSAPQLRFLQAYNICGDKVAWKSA